MTRITAYEPFEVPPRWHFLRVEASDAVFDYDEGDVDVPTGPGLGIDIDLEYVRERSEVAPDWHNPVWRHDGGSITEW